MRNYIVTFFSHYDATVFAGFLKGQGIEARLMPTPRKISASCGTCVSFVSGEEMDFSGFEIDGVYEKMINGFSKLV